MSCSVAVREMIMEYCSFNVAVFGLEMSRLDKLHNSHCYRKQLSLWEIIFEKQQMLITFATAPAGD